MNARVSPQLQEAPLFRSLSEADRTRLVPHTRVHDCRRGDRVFTKGSPSDWLDLRTSGRVKVLKTTLDGNDVVLAIFGIGVSAAAGSSAGPPSGRGAWAAEGT